MEKNKTKICYIISSLDKQGPVNVLYNIIKHINYNEFDVLLIALKAKTANSRVADFKSLPISVVEINNISRLNILKLFLRVSSLINSFSPQIIHTHCLRSLFISLLLKSKYRILYTIHIYPGEQLRKIYGEFNGTIISLMAIYLYRRTPWLITCSNSLQKELLQKINLHTFPIPNGVDSADQPIDKFSIRNEQNLSLNTKYFITIGRFSEEKNFLFLLDSFSKPEFQDFGLIILGSGDLYDSLLSYSSDRIIMPGFVSNTSDFLAISDYYISTSKTEGLPMSVLEAMSFQLPLILSEIPSHLEIIESSDHCIGFTFKNNDFESLNRAMKNLSNCDIEEIKINIKETFLSHYSAKEMSKKYQAFYLNILNQ